MIFVSLSAGLQLLYLRLYFQKTAFLSKDYFLFIHLYYYTNTIIKLYLWGYLPMTTRLSQSPPHNFSRCGPGGPGAKDFSTMQRAKFYEQGFLLGA